MKDIKPISELRVFYDRAENERLLVGRLAYQKGVALLGSLFLQRREKNTLFVHRSTSQKRKMLVL